MSATDHIHSILNDHLRSLAKANISFIKNLLKILWCSWVFLLL